ncbi:hypothetical protein PCYB_006760, partial [Plasmodium cynomolgi strain B]
CKLFNYWIYGELARKYDYNYIRKVIPAFGGVNLVLNDLLVDEFEESYRDKCEAYFDITQQDDWKKGKELYEYYFDYEDLFSLAQSGEDEECTYYNKIQENKIIRLFQRSL